MAFFSNDGIAIAGMACAVPDHKIDVESFSERFGEEAVAKFVKSTGIEAICTALPNQTASDLAYAAAVELLSKVPIDREEIEALLFVTQSPDYRRPASACVLQSRLGLSMNCAAMDIGLGCSGFVYGVQVAMSMMQTSDMRYALLLLGETASKLVDPNDKSIVMMYGDAGVAVLLERRDGEAMNSLLMSDGDRYKAIVLPAGGFRDMYPPRDRFVCSDGIERSLYDIFMDGTAVFSFTITDVPQTICAYLERVGKQAQDFDYFVPHQANQFILKQLVRKLKLDKNKVLMSLDKYGNTGGNSIPLTICDALGGQSSGTAAILASGFGIGLSWGVCSFNLDLGTTLPVVSTADYYTEGKLVPGKY